MKEKNITIVICCAGMGKRLGIGTPKALLNIEGKPLIIRQLELLDDYDDIRIVVGYKAEEVIKTVLSYRKDVMFVFNYDYESTSVVASIQKAAIRPREYILEIDGDILVNKDDLEKIFRSSGECIGCSEIHSTEAIYAGVKDGKVVNFQGKDRDYEWTGLAKIKRDTLIEDDDFLYMALQKYLPMEYIYVRSRDIDTADDYINAVEWYKSGCE